MAKEKTFFQCSSCGLEQPKWLGRCPACGEWNTFLEVKHSQMKKSAAGMHTVPKAVTLGSIHEIDAKRIHSGIHEFDRVLGGGMMPGGSVLIGGEPGIGKSTLLLHIAGAAAEAKNVLYITGEESPGQVKMRADRLNIARKDVHILNTTNLDIILQAAEREKPALIFIDSIQTVVSEELGSVPGTVNQIKYCCYECISWAREHKAVIILVAHVTKEGSIAGPKVIEHMVDTVLYFEYGAADLRVIKATKNRYGSVDEIGLFSMSPGGLLEIENPSAFLLSRRKPPMPAGVSVAPVYEGSRILLVEIQALIVPAKGSISRVFSEKIDKNRISRLAAVCEKHLGIRFADQDIYVNVGGGIRISEVGIDLPLTIALYSARADIPVPHNIVMAGEISLAGEIRPTAHLHRRMKTAGETGFTRFIGPAVKEKPPAGQPEITWQMVNTLKEAVQAVFSGKK